MRASREALGVRKNAVVGPVKSICEAIFSESSVGSDLSQVQAMNISVILCTYNRCSSVAKALDSVARSEMPETVTWEVLVVDNNSNDKTREVVEDFCGGFPGRFRYCFEPKPGKSNALNTGIREAKGAILAFMDDDVLVSPTWLRSITAPLVQSDLAGAGGRIVAQQMPSIPDWLAMDGECAMEGVLALFDLGNEAKELNRPPYGTNMAFQSRVFEQYGGFRTDLGPRPGSELRDEDTEFGKRLLAAGEHLWYEPAAVVYHAVPENRLTKKYFLRFWYDQGRAWIRESANRNPVFGLPRWLFSIPLILMIPLPIKMYMWLVERDAKRRFFYKGVVWMTVGQIVELPKVWLAERARKRAESCVSTRSDRDGAVSGEIS